jgi:hypothetical protein
MAKHCWPLDHILFRQREQPSISLRREICQKRHTGCLARCVSSMRAGLISSPSCQSRTTGSARPSTTGWHALQRPAADTALRCRLLPIRPVALIDCSHACQPLLAASGTTGSRGQRTFVSQTSGNRSVAIDAGTGPIGAGGGFIRDRVENGAPALAVFEAVGRFADLTRIRLGAGVMSHARGQQHERKSDPQCPDEPLHRAPLDIVTHNRAVGSRNI